MSGIYHYVNNDPHQSDTFELTNSESVLVVIWEKEEGEFLTDFSGVKIKYNTKTGNVTPVSEPVGGIDNEFSEKIFTYVIALIETAISLLAKYELLLRLLELEDKDISNIIKQNLFDKKTGKVIQDEDAVIRTLSKILREIKPDKPWSRHLFSAKEKNKTHKVVHSVLSNPKNHHSKIKAKNHAADIMQEIKDKMKEAEVLLNRRHGRG